MVEGEKEDSELHANTLFIFFPPRSSEIQEHGNAWSHGHRRLYFYALVPVSSAVPYIISQESTRKNQAQLIVIQMQYLT